MTKKKENAESKSETKTNYKSSKNLNTRGFGIRSYRLEGNDTGFLKYLKTNTTQKNNVNPELQN